MDQIEISGRRSQFVGETVEIVLIDELPGKLPLLVHMNNYDYD